ncbi:Cyclin, N-terminal domain [Ceratobasidium sp. AG-Ba]|nr:Cyclin, N-terminal domain [Ceratobasidium sp. AG-Ba]
MLTACLPPLSTTTSAPALARSRSEIDRNLHRIITSATQPFPESHTMKATNPITRASRGPYSKAKRTSTMTSVSSPNGVGKTRSSSSLHRRTPSNPSSMDVLKRQRTMQLNALSRDVKKLLEEEYREEVIQYMHDMEKRTMSSSAAMEMQPELQWEMRPCLVDFLIEVHLQFRLRPETLYLALNIVDRYVSRRVVYKKHYQLVGCSALWIAAKFEDAKDRVPTVQDLHTMCRATYDESAFIQMEGHVLATIQWTVGHPTAESWLRIACTNVCFEDTETQHVARFIMETTLFYREFIDYPPSVLANASLLLGRHVLGKARRAHEMTPEILEVVRLLDELYATRIQELSPVVVEKYNPSYFSNASAKTVRFYLNGGRFDFTPIPVLAPVTPLGPRRSLSSRSMSVCSNMSDVSTPSTCSETDDEMPITPHTPMFPLHASNAPYMVSRDKENVPSAVRVNAFKTTGDEDTSMHFGGSNHFSILYGQQRSALSDLNASRV